MDCHADPVAQLSAALANVRATSSSSSSSSSALLPAHVQAQYHQEAADAAFLQAQQHVQQQMHSQARHQSATPRYSHVPLPARTLASSQQSPSLSHSQTARSPAVSPMMSPMMMMQPSSVRMGHHRMRPPVGFMARSQPVPQASPDSLQERQQHANPYAWADAFLEAEDDTAEATSLASPTATTVSSEHKDVDHQVHPPPELDPNMSLDDFMAQVLQSFVGEDEVDAVNHAEPVDTEEDAVSRVAADKTDNSIPEEDLGLSAEELIAKGKEQLEKGRVVSAIEYFVKACEKAPDNADAWELLGTSRAENEQDFDAIAALIKCTELDPARRSALISLATAYANEIRNKEAYLMLQQALLADPRYSSLTAVLHTQMPFVQETWHEALEDLYFQAVSTVAGENDADVQVGLGILQHMSGHYDRAIECFEVALSLRPDDFQLWNKLGACLANGNNSAEAVDAYKRALSLRPGFVRAIYNLGVSCINMKAYEQAIQHFIAALDLQASQGANTRSMSDSIWSSLQMTLMILEQYDMAILAKSKDLSALKMRFPV